MTFIKLINEHLIFINENYGQFDEEAKKMADNAVERLFCKMNEIVKGMDKCSDKEKLVKILDKTKNQNYLDSEKLVDSLEQKSKIEYRIIASTRSFLIDKLQIILNLLLQLVNKKHEGPDSFAKLSLFHLCVDEILAAFHLAQHSFVNQSYSHIRSI